MNQQWAAFATALLGYPRHRSQHSGGFVISRTKLSRMVPIENAAMTDRTITQWDKDILRGTERDDAAPVLPAASEGREIMTVRQRPGTAKGVLSITLEDETGQTNVIVRPTLLEKYRREAPGASLLAVCGVCQTEGKVQHLVPKELRDRSELLGALRVESHDFHQDSLTVRSRNDRGSLHLGSNPERGRVQTTLLLSSDSDISLQR